MCVSLKDPQFFSLSVRTYVAIFLLQLSLWAKKIYSPFFELEFFNVKKRRFLGSSGLIPQGKS